MSAQRIRGLIYLTALLGLGAGSVLAGEYPRKPIRLLVSGIAGSSNFAARLIADGLSGSLGQQVVVDGREGGVTVSTIAAQAKPDGYTLHLNGSALWLSPFMRSSTPYDPVRDFSPIALTNRVPNLVVVHPSLPARSIRDLISLAKAKPGELNCAAGNLGTSNHLAAELFKAMAGVNIVSIPYKGAAPALNDLIGGHVHLMFPSASSAVPHVKAGRLRALAVTAAQPTALAPGLPTVSASGVPGYESVAIFGVFAPAKTPGTIISQLNREIVKVLNDAEVKNRFFNAGSDVVGGSPQEFAEAVKSEMIKWGKVIKDAGIRFD